MKHMLLAMTLAVSPVAAQEFASDAPAVDAILAKTRALQAASAASHASAKLLHDIDKTKGLIEKYGDDPLRAGIYKAELSLLQLKLAIELYLYRTSLTRMSLTSPSCFSKRRSFGS